MAASSSAIYPSLRNKTVILTGAAEGIGAAAVELFARQGSNVCIFDISRASAESLISHISALKPFHPDFSISTPKFWECDVTDLDRLKACVGEVVAAFGGVDVLVNNAAAAGGAARKGTMEVDAQGWEGNLNVNLRHVFFMTQFVVPIMRERGGGCIINMGSISWYVAPRPFPLPSFRLHYRAQHQALNLKLTHHLPPRRIPAVGTPVYMAAKAAILGLTKTHSKEFGADNIRVNSVMPGAIATERQKAEVYGPDPAYRDFCLAQQTIKRDLEPREVGALVVFLASADASAVTGSSYVVDGGWVSDV